MAEDYIQLPADGTGKKVRTISETVGGHTVHTTYITIRQEPTYYAFSGGVTPAVTNLFVILNRNTSKLVKVYRVNLWYVGISAVTGTLGQYELRRVTATAALSGGTSVTPIKFDTNDPSLTNVDVMVTPTTSLTNVGVIKSFIQSNDEPAVSTLDADAYASQVFPRDAFSVFSADILTCKPIILRSDGSTHQGLSIYGVSGTVGTIAMSFLFTYDDQ